MLVAAWAASGVTGLLIVTGLDLISARFFLVGAALATAFVAFATGTSWGTVSTLGVALMGVAHGLGIPLAAAAGAVVAGSHFGDKLSPLSETATLAAVVAGTDLYTHIRHTILTTLPAFLLSLGLYLVLGHQAASAPTMPASGELQATIAQYFTLHWALWLPVMVVLAAAVFRWPVVQSLLGSGVLALLLAVWLQQYPMTSVPRLIWQGYRPATGVPAVDTLLAQGGIWTMGQIAFAAVALFALMLFALRSRAGQKLLAQVNRMTTTRFRAVAVAVGLGVSLMLASGATYLAILVTGELLRGSFERLGLAPENLSRTLEDSGTVVAPLIPWGVSGLFMTRTLGVSTWEYAPFAALNYLGFLIALLYGYTGWFIRYRRPA